MPGPAARAPADRVRPANSGHVRLSWREQAVTTAQAQATQIPRTRKLPLPVLAICRAASDLLPTIHPVPPSVKVWHGHQRTTVAAGAHHGHHVHHSHHGLRCRDDPGRWTGRQAGNTMS
jgi:hypothetical protein